MQQTLTDRDISAIRGALLTFFDDSARPLPWRQTRDPYAIWVSEVMAQQTRVETVVPYYHRWLGRFPNVRTLADASLDDVLKMWEGLGYYSRARNLHAAARLLREHHEGAVPDSYEALCALPGVGEYTAGAVSSIAFGAPRPAVDGNVRRVLSRVLDLPAPPATLLSDVAAALVPADRPGDFNQALMELGAMICTPRTPRCARCPIARQCGAHAAGTQEYRPRARRKKAVPTVDVATAILRDPAGRLLVVRRPAHGLLAGMWAFPGVELRPGHDPAEQTLLLARACVRMRSRRTADQGGSRTSELVDRPRAIGVVEHTFSHRHERYHCFIIEATAAGASSEEAAGASFDDMAWIADDDSERALPRAQQRIRSLALADCDLQRGARKGSNAVLPER